MRKYLLYLLMGISFSACTKKDNAVGSKVEQIPPHSAGNADEGKKLYASCAPCHGVSGEGNDKLNSPALANADSWYLYRQLMNFRSGIRGNAAQDTLGNQMAMLAKSLKDSTSVSHLVAFIKTMPKATLPALISGDIKKGQRTYETICGSCHGQSAKGNEKINAPNLHGLDDWYIRRQVRNFKSGVRGAHHDDILGAQMVPMVALLPNDQAVDDVIAYIRSTAQPNSQ